MGKNDYNLKMDHALQKASPEEKAKAKEKAIDGGMPQKVADKVFKMGSKGVFEMKPGHKNKPISELNMSHKDELMMKALYTHGPDGKPHPISALSPKQRETHGFNSIPFVSLKDKSNVRPLFNEAFSEARKQGHKTFGFGYDRDNDGNILSDEIHVYNTKLKGEK
jgi:hypothetical protein